MTESSIFLFICILCLLGITCCKRATYCINPCNNSGAFAICILFAFIVILFLSCNEAHINALPEMLNFDDHYRAISACYFGDFAESISTTEEVKEYVASLENDKKQFNLNEVNEDALCAVDETIERLQMIDWDSLNSSEIAQTFEKENQSLNEKMRNFFIEDASSLRNTNYCWDLAIEMSERAVIWFLFIVFLYILFYCLTQLI